MTTLKYEQIQLKLGTINKEVRIVQSSKLQILTDHTLPIYSRSKREQLKKQFISPAQRFGDGHEISKYNILPKEKAFKATGMILKLRISLLPN